MTETPSLKASEPLLSLDEASFGYGHKLVLHNVNLAIYPGDYICIVGENGAGKSTLMKGLLGQLSPLTGDRRLSPQLLSEGVGYVAQANAVQGDFPAGVREVVLSGRLAKLGWRPFYSRADRAAADEVMRDFDLAHLARQSCRTLSGGQLRRVLIARAFLACSSLLMLDEPAAGLDQRNADHVMTLLSHINQRHGTAVVQITHDATVTKRWATAVWRVEGGHVVVERSRPTGTSAETEPTCLACAQARSTQDEASARAGLFGGYRS